MATPALVLALATACAGPREVWLDIQRERLERMHEDRSDYAVVAEAVRRIVAEATRPQQPQEPQEHLDQRLPPPPGRKFGHPWQPLRVAAHYGIGETAVRVSGTMLDDRTDSTSLGVRVDTGVGAGLDVGAWSSDAGMFEGRFVNDGVDPQPANAELAGYELFPHYRIDGIGGEGWQLPVRVGLATDRQQLDHRAARVQREWTSFGPRVAIEPSWNLLGDDRRNLQLFGSVGGSVGPAWFREEFTTGSDRDVVSRWSLDASVGLRANVSNWHAVLGYRVQQTTFGTTDAELFGRRSETELQTDQLFFGLGVSY